MYQRNENKSFFKARKSIRREIGSIRHEDKNQCHGSHPWESPPNYLNIIIKVTWTTNCGIADLPPRGTTSHLQHEEKWEREHQRSKGILPGTTEGSQVGFTHPDLGNDHGTEYKIAGPSQYSLFGAGIEGLELDYKSPLITPRKAGAR